MNFFDDEMAYARGRVYLTKNGVAPYLPEWTDMCESYVAGERYQFKKLIEFVDATEELLNVFKDLYTMMPKEIKKVEKMIEEIKGVKEV